MDNKSGEGQWPAVVMAKNDQRARIVKSHGFGMNWQTINYLTNSPNKWPKRTNGWLSIRTQKTKQHTNWNEICKQNTQSSECPNHLIIWNDEMDFMLLLCLGSVRFRFGLDIEKALEVQWHCHIRRKTGRDGKVSATIWFNFVCFCSIGHYLFSFFDYVSN